MLITRAHLAVARHLLVADFGQIVADIGTRLLSHGPTSFIELLRALQLPKSQVRNSLLVLIQHNLVKCTEKVVSVAAAKKRASHVTFTPIPLYEASLDDIFVRPCFPRLLQMARSRFGADEAMLLQQLMACGRLTSEQLIERACAAHAAAQSLEADSPALTDRRRELHAALAQIREARYISPSEMLSGHQARAVPACGGCTWRATASSSSTMRSRSSWPTRWTATRGSSCASR